MSQDHTRLPPTRGEGQGLLDAVWWSSRAVDSAVPEKLLRRIDRNGAWVGNEFVLRSGLGIAGLNWDFTPASPRWGCPAHATISLMAFCGIHESTEETEYASLSPAEARALGRALLKAARLADAAVKASQSPVASDGEVSKAAQPLQTTEPKSSNPANHTEESKP